MRGHGPLPQAQRKTKSTWERAWEKCSLRSLKRIRLPAGETDPVRIMLRQPGGVARTYGKTLVWLDPADGTVLATREPTGR